MLKGKNILLGVSGGIAAYKMANVASALVMLGADVHVILTKGAEHFITAETFEALTKNKCYTDVFDRGEDMFIPHITLAEQADVFMIAPASADIIGKIANGIADDMLSTTVLPCTAPVLIAPSMNVNMYNNAIVQDNMAKLVKFGYKLIEPAEGHLACNYDGKGKLPEPEVLVEHIIAACTKKDLVGKKVLVTAGATQESLDPVRYITNHSTGKMGYSIAKAAANRGADVVLVSGETNLSTPIGVRRVDIKSAEDMYNAVVAEFADTDIVIKAAAVADYTPLEYVDNKIKKSDGDMSIPLKRTKDILAYLGENKKVNQFICGFSMETENMIENSRAKLTKKNVDMIAANNLKVAGAGFGVDTNILTLITSDDINELPMMSKDECADMLLDVIVEKI